MDNTSTMSRDVMNGFPPDRVAVYGALVSELATFYRWLASVQSSTQPNRLYVHSGTSAGDTSNVPWLLVNGYPQGTIFDNLHHARLSFGIYNQNIPTEIHFQAQMLVKVYEALRSSPQSNQTLLVINYEEPGGFYDHVPNPVAGFPSPDGIVGPEFKPGSYRKVNSPCGCYLCKLTMGIEWQVGKARIQNT